MYRTDMYEGLLAETLMITGANGDSINAYFARPLGAGPRRWLAGVQPRLGSHV